VQRRRELALSAASLFVKKGYRQTSMKDIAERCGISVGTLYYYIHSKDDILTLFQEITSEELDKFSRKNLKILLQKSPGEAIKKAIDSMISFIEATQDITVFWYQEARNLKPAQMKNLYQREAVEIDMLKKMLQRGCDQGEFKIKDINLAAHNIIVLCDMWAFRRWIMRKDYTFEQFKKAQTDFILSKIMIE
jgi:AcrR family transcriptional regulator